MDFKIDIDLIAEERLPVARCQQHPFLGGPGVCQKIWSNLSDSREDSSESKYREGHVRSRNYASTHSARIRDALALYMYRGPTRWDFSTRFILRAYAIASSRMLGYSTCSWNYNLIAG